MNRQMQAPLNLTDTPEQIATELLEHAIINWRDVPSIAKLMTQAFIQRANETAEYIVNKEKHVVNSNDLELEETNASQNQEEKPLPPTASVQSPAPPLPEAEAAASVAANANSSESEQDDQDKASQDVLVDPTPPQKLEGELAGLEPIIGTPQITLNEAVSAGTTHGGLHFPKDHRFIYSGAVSEMDQKLQTEIAEWQKRMHEFLVEAAINQQNDAAATNAQQPITVPQQNGGGQEEAHHDSNASATSSGAAPSAVSPPTSTVNNSENEENHKPAVARSSSQQREWELF